MGVYLDEDMVGSHPTKVGYPHLLLCMGVTVVLDDGSLCGAHFTKPTTEQMLLRMLLREVLKTGRTMRTLYCAADVAEHCGRHGGLDIRGKAAGLGFHGTGYLFDFGQHNPTNGAYVQVVSNGPNGACDVTFRLEENVEYKTKREFAHKAKDVVKVRDVWHKHMMTAKVVKSSTYGVSVKDGGTLRDADLKRVDIP